MLFVAKESGRVNNEKIIKISDYCGGMKSFELFRRKFGHKASGLTICVSVCPGPAGFQNPTRWRRIEAATRDLNRCEADW
jgi:epoxyqueuosine reductase QueG